MDADLLERMLDISYHMAEARALEPVLNYAMDQAIQLVGAERGFLVLISPDGLLDVRVQRGQDIGLVADASDQISRSILGKVIQTSLPVVVQNAIEDPNWDKFASITHLKLRSVMCVPLLSRGDLIGAIYVENRSLRGLFSETDVVPLLFFANQAGVLIENATLNDELEARVTARTKELEQAKAHVEEGWTEAVEVNRMRTVLLGNIAHDLRSPLSIVIQSLGLLREGALGDLNEAQSEWMGKALEAANYVLNLSNDVFDLTKIEMGGLALYPQETKLNEYLTKIFNIGLGLPWPSGVKFCLNLEADLPRLSLDPIRISQVLVNLFSNALKFTTQGTVTLYAANQCEKNRVLIGVVDTGEGVPPEKMDQLFQRFQQIDRNRERRRMGTGLGLAICRELVEMHGGQIWAESSVGTGSDFKFVLPIHGKIVSPDQ
jgi:signal transduction histidine kinase